MNESEQAQAIAEIKDALKVGVILYSDVSAYLKTTLKIVDSQAQKIKEQAARISELEKEAREHVCCLANNGW